ncbi:MAG: epoxyqueuosine reductase QueH [Acetobacteraceae bacterium]|nr:epoxyqueuosine reductase QueH [Acetobacteraceae bacterium]
MKLLMHICCAPCAAYPLLNLLLPEGHQVKGLWFNPNVQPYREFERRLSALEALAMDRGLVVEAVRSYPLAGFLRGLLAAMDGGEVRCTFCYRVRLEEAARRAALQGAEAFTTSLLVSPFQKHDLVRRAGEDAARQVGVPFLYRDWRPYWPQAVALSRELKLYRQPYCGCVFSEAERYRAPAEDGPAAGPG